jgi:predicted ribosome quality control (RQC) complex YloA/Tae2 family protein
MKVVKEFSNFDVFAIVKELDTILTDGSISNIYEVQDLLILKINTNLGKKNLIIKKDSRINLTEFDYPIPDFPNQYIRTLRKLLKNRRILNVTQFKFDRIIIIELTNREEGTWKFIIELFNKGNFLLLDQNNSIIIAKRYRKFKDRSILPKKEYIFPKSNEKDFFTLNKEDFKVFFEKSENEIVREISRKLKLSGLYSEEICFRANVNKKELGKNLIDDDITKLYDSFKRIRNEMLFGAIKAYIVINNQDQEIAVLPFEMEIIKAYTKKFFSSFNEAVDDFYSKIDYESIKSPKDKKIKEMIKDQQKIITNQQYYLEELKTKKKKYYELGDFLYNNFNRFEKLLSVILDARKKKYPWKEINEKLIKAKNEKLDGAEFFNRIIPSTNQLLIKINDENVYLDLKKSIGENINLIYSKGKKAEKKIKGTISAINKTNDKISKLELEKESLDIGIDFLVKKPRKKWYEKFRWFHSSDGFLIIGGRDAATNEIIFKKYLEPSDLIFHTNFPGSPLVLIKNPENKEISLITIEETAEFVASFSRAWKENWGVVDTFYINPDQISRTPPSGEYLQKGSFIITGKKNFINNVKTELTIGLIFIELQKGSANQNNAFFPKIISGPETAIKKQVNNIITIVPSKSNGLTKGKLAKEIKSHFIREIGKDLKKWLELLSLDEILLYLPNGFSMIKSQY